MGGAELRQPSRVGWQQRYCILQRGWKRYGTRPVVWILSLILFFTFLSGQVKAYPMCSVNNNKTSPFSLSPSLIPFPYSFPFPVPHPWPRLGRPLRNCGRPFPILDQPILDRPILGFLSLIPSSFLTSPSLGRCFKLPHFEVPTGRTGFIGRSIIKYVCPNLVSPTFGLALLTDLAILGSSLLFHAYPGDALFGQ